MIRLFAETKRSNFLEGTVGATRLGVDEGLRNAEQSVLVDRIDKVVHMFRLDRFGPEAWFYFLFFLVERFRHALQLAYPSK